MIAIILTLILTLCVTGLVGAGVRVGIGGSLATETNSAYECGFLPLQMPHLTRIGISFFFVAVSFLIFDVETVLLLSWVAEPIWSFNVALFWGVLIATLIVELGEGVLETNEEDKKKLVYSIASVPFLLQSDWWDGLTVNTLFPVAFHNGGYLLQEPQSGWSSLDKAAVVTLILGSLLLLIIQPPKPDPDEDRINKKDKTPEKKKEEKPQDQH